MTPEEARGLAMDANSVRGGVYALEWFLRGLAMGTGEPDRALADAIGLAGRTLELARVVEAALRHESNGTGDETDG